MKRFSPVCRACLSVSAANLALFGVKLYIGLASNSVAVYTDAVNNLFDSLSGGVTFAGLFALTRTPDPAAPSAVVKGEQLFSCVVSVILCFTGGYFLYTSAEGLMYPWPIWFTPLHVYMLVLTAGVKAALFFVLRAASKKTDSDVLRLMAADSLLDLGVTLTAAASLPLSASSVFRFDSLAGIGISIAIIIPAVKSLIAGARRLLCVPAASVRRQVNAALTPLIEEGRVSSLQYLDTPDGMLLLIFATSDRAGSLNEHALTEKTGVRVCVLPELRLKTGKE